ncbi:MAG: hypothetical protein DWQ47_17185 [Acidobacteria bacterium]|nr:MAG: hypothetical protein DWQ32_04585 [Acidobacteriota bacterium]REK02225.1 MAG: hypothetical protein DWQ38_07565 [Acidobacteriota bacterium]REK13972.1 MAG: hypothetical protein DWQ43_10275 [Acidobacteriota bacterium]REK41967.1 MAG: hypothetical protein DWQ47_17185 [Acidobacteriota bacterium]
MVKIHVPGDGHSPPPPDPIATYDPYTDLAKKNVVEDALRILRNNVRGTSACNNCFSQLPGGRTFDQIIDDDTIFIHYDPSDRFMANTLGNNITINEYSISRGRWIVAATLVHELAHVNGAPGNTHAAEATLPPCGFAALYDPSVQT